MKYILPDLLQPNLKVVFIGTAPGTQSAQANAYYAGRGNRFWPTLFRIGLTPRHFLPSEYRNLIPLGIGLTDLNKRSFGKQAKSLASSTVFLLPSTSGLAIRTWNESFWQELGSFVRS